MGRSNEPFWWALFSAGGVVAAFLMPITIVITSFGVALGWVSSAQLFMLLKNPLVRVYLVILISLPLFHWAHRFRFTLVDLGLKKAKGIIAVLCYGSAILGSALAVVAAIAM